MDRERKYPAVVAALFLMSLMLGLVMIAVPAAAAPDTRYYVPSCNGSPWVQPGSTNMCWALTSGGAGGASNPTLATDVIMDVNSGGFVAISEGPVAEVANSITITSATTVAWSLSSGTSLTIKGDMSEATSSDSITFTVGGNGASDGIFYGGVFRGTSSVNHQLQGVPGQITYTGPNAYGTMTHQGVTSMTAVGKTIYCWPGCADNGGNTNIVFGPFTPTFTAARYRVAGCTNQWDDSACWSTTSGGAGGASIPTSANDVVFDANSPTTSMSITDITASARDFWVINRNGGVRIQTPNLNPAATAVLSVRSFQGYLNNEGQFFYIFRFGDQGSSTFEYSGQINTNVPNPDCETTGTVGGLCFEGGAPSPDSRTLTIKYAGTGFALAHNTSFFDSTAAPATVYCYPNCYDGGGNTNILFSQAPSPAVPPPVGGPIPTAQLSNLPSLVAFSALAVAVVAGIVLLASLALGLWRALRPWLLVILVFAVVIYLVLVL